MAALCAITTENTNRRSRKDSPVNQPVPDTGPDEPYSDLPGDYAIEWTEDVDANQV